MKMMKNVLAAMVLAGTVASAHAATLFSNRTTFNAAGAGTSTFNDLDTIAAQIFAPFTIGTLSFTGNALAVPAANTSAGLNGAPNNTAWVQYQLNTGGGAVTLTNSAAFRMIGFDFRPYVDNGGGSDVGETISYITNTGETGTFVTPTSNITGFVGFVFAGPVTSVTFAATDGGGNFFSWFGTDNYQLYSSTAAAGAVPEPATWGMMILGFGLMGAGMRRAICRSEVKFNDKIKRIAEGTIA